MADHVLYNNGIVFGAVYDPKGKRVKHESTDEYSLEEMRKSKYVQSYIGDSYRKVKAALGNNRIVLFVGTPCQVDGLQNYLGYSNDNLLTADFICHGVPPMKLLLEDLQLLQKSNDVIINFDFRPKIKTWSYDYFSIFMESRKRRDIPWNYDSYFKAFIDNLTLRKSCYQCKYSSLQHKADVTLADFWGHKRFNKNIFDNRGLSLVLANTVKGEKFLNAIGYYATLQEIDWGYAEYVFFERKNANYNRKKRDEFFEVYRKYGYLKAIKEFNLIPSLKDKIIKYGTEIKKKLLRV